MIYTGSRTMNGKRLTIRKLLWQWRTFQIYARWSRRDYDVEGIPGRWRLFFRMVGWIRKVAQWVGKCKKMCKKMCKKIYNPFPRSTHESLPNHIACNICGGRYFRRGPWDRKCVNGKLPECAKCGCKERHRALRKMWDRVIDAEYRKMDVIQFSNDLGAKRQWFGSFEVSNFGGSNSLDLLQIDRPDSSYDIAICNHILEHIEDDRRAFRELMRIVKANGILQFSVPSPALFNKTWGWNFLWHDHYRMYGRDLVERFMDALPGVSILEVPIVDDVTEVPDFAYFASFDTDRLKAVQKAVQSRLGEDHYNRSSRLACTRRHV